MAIKSFSCEHNQGLFAIGKSKEFSGITKVAMRKLAMLDAAANLQDLAVPPGNRLEVLKGDRDGQHSIHVNEQYRVCFVWTDAGVENVENVDYH